MRLVVASLTAVLSGWMGQAAAAPYPVVQIRPALETPGLPDNALEADADDPAIWVHPTRPARSLVVTAVKDGGMRVYDLAGALVQTIDPFRAEQGEGRINNVDVAYGLAVPGGGRIDVAVATDRALDVIRIFKIDPTARVPLTEVTAFPQQRAFPERPRSEGTGLEANPLDDQNTAYGLAIWHDRDANRLFAVATQRGTARLGVFLLRAREDGKVVAVFKDEFRFPVVHDGQDLRIENEDDPLLDWSPQFEGLVVDQRRGILYAGQEDVGIWRVNLNTGKADDAPFYETRGSSKSSFFEPGSRISRDVEGLCIYYGPGRTGYLIASSQGNAHGEAPTPDAPFDDSFAVFELRFGPPRLLGSFRVRRNQGIDTVQESDGADVISTGLPGFPQGLFITQDGYDNDILSGDPEATNFKYVPWERIARSFNPPLAIAPNAWNPRRP